MRIKFKLIFQKLKSTSSSKLFDLIAVKFIPEKNWKVINNSGTSSVEYETVHAVESLGVLKCAVCSGCNVYGMSMI